MKYLFILIFLLFSVNSKAKPSSYECDKVLSSHKIMTDYLTGDELYSKALHYYDNSTDVHNYEVSYCLLNLAIDKGFSDAKVILAEFYEYGYVVEKDHNKAFNLVQDAYQTGSLLVLNSLGNYYFNGIGISPDLKKGVHYYQEAINKGNFETSKINLGYAYFYGLGTEKNVAEAIKLTKSVLSTDNKEFNAQAMANLGVFYKELGDADNAFLWTNQAADLGNVSAETNLGFLYAYGIGVKANKEKALYWLKKAMDKKHSEAYFILGRIYEKGTSVIEKSSLKAFELYSMAAHQGHGMAKNNLAVMLINGKDVKKDETRALELFLEAAEEYKVVFSMIALYQIYSQGTKEIPQDLEKAKYWLEKAKENGFSPK
ncbi:MAG: SEL1-like repeat protein [[Actinobacillus] rossii]|nr:SEL1-like repeat protein [Gallibacter sp.]MDY4505546.1 SEL1-like repeat protein [[Actinobacillus] rossii]